MIHTLRGLLARLIFYGFFIALGTVLAEVFSYNYTEALLDPWGYLPYGLLYIFFVDTLLRRRVNDWKTVYLYGVLVGFITEGFVAKVIFFGWNADSTVLLGFAPAETLFLTFVFHPLCSFILPVFIARNFVDFPFNLPRSRHPRLVVLAAIPLYALIMGATNNKEVATLAVHLPLTLIVFVAWTVLLKKWGGAETIILKKSTRAGVGILTIAFYVFAWFFFDTGYREEVLFPPWPVTVAGLLFTAFVFALIAIKLKGSPNIQVAYTPTFPLWKWLGCCILAAVLLMLAAINPLAPLFGGLFTVSFIGGIFLGPLYFGYVAADAIIRPPKIQNTISFTDNSTFA